MLDAHLIAIHVNIDARISSPTRMDRAYMQVFNWLPLAAHVENKILCMHGGIGRSINRIKQIEVLYRPLTMEQGGVVLMDLLWSDPTTNDGVQVRICVNSGCVAYVAEALVITVASVDLLFDTTAWSVLQCCLRGLSSAVLQMSMLRSRGCSRCSCVTSS